MRITLASTGMDVPLGRSVQAVKGPYAGTWWRLDDVRKANGQHLICASRTHRVGRHRITVAPDMFGLVIEEIVRFARHCLNTLHAVRVKIDDGIILGFLALIPLALFEAFHGGEWTRHIIEVFFNSRANGGGSEH